MRHLQKFYIFLYSYEPMNKSKQFEVKMWLKKKYNSISTQSAGQNRQHIMQVKSVILKKTLVLSKRGSNKISSENMAMHAEPCCSQDTSSKTEGFFWDVRVTNCMSRCQLESQTNFKNCKIVKLMSQAQKVLLICKKISFL